jgi:hypothetical protein
MKVNVHHAFKLFRLRVAVDGLSQIPFAIKGWRSLLPVLGFAEHNSIVADMNVENDAVLERGKQASGKPRSANTVH